VVCHVAELAVALVGPSGTAEHERQSVRPGVGTGDVTSDVDQFVRGDLDRVERVDVLGQPVDDGFVVVFFLERAEHAVPDDEDAAVVAVQVLAVRAVMDAMVRSGVEHLLRRAQLADRVGVDPVLVDQVDPAGSLDHLGSESE
jgi:hypothetical protein